MRCQNLIHSQKNGTRNQGHRSLHYALNFRQRGETWSSRGWNWYRQGDSHSIRTSRGQVGHHLWSKAGQTGGECNRDHCPSTEGNPDPVPASRPSQSCPSRRSAQGHHRRVRQDRCVRLQRRLHAAHRRVGGLRRGRLHDGIRPQRPHRFQRDPSLHQGGRIRGGPTQHLYGHGAFRARPRPEWLHCLESGQPENGGLLRQRVPGIARCQHSALLDTYRSQRSPCRGT